MTSQTIYAYTDIHKNTVMVGETDLNFTGTWSSGGTYWADPKDTVQYGNTNYVAIVDNENVVPTFVPRKGQRKWSELAVIRSGTHFDEHTIDAAYDLAAEARTIAIAGTNAAAEAQTDANYASGLASIALQTAWAGTAAAASAAAGVQQTLQIVAAGTNQEQTDHAAALAASYAAIQTAWTGTTAAQSAAAGVQQAIQIAVNGTNAASAGIQQAIQIAVNGTTSANAGIQQAIQIAVNGTVAAAAGIQQAIQIAVNGTVAAAAGIQQAIQIAVNGTNAASAGIAAAQATGNAALVTAWAGTAAANANAHERVGLSYVIDGAGAEIVQGFKGFVEIPFAMWITGWSMVAEQSGSCVVDIVKSNGYAGFPTTSSIVDNDRPTLNNAQKNQNTNPSAWVRAIGQGDLLGFTVLGSGTVQSVTVALSGTRS